MIVWSCRYSNQEVSIALRDPPFILIKAKTQILMFFSFAEDKAFSDDCCCDRLFFKLFPLFKNGRLKFENLLNKIKRWMKKAYIFKW